MTVTIEFGRAGGQLVKTGAMLERGNAISSETIVATGANQISAGAAPQLNDQTDAVVTIVTDENIFVSIRGAPNALTDTAVRRALTAGTFRSFACAIGDKVAVVTR